ncbi:hypothetical protein ES703_36161 [subsurface metagenome]
MHIIKLNFRSFIFLKRRKKVTARLIIIYAILAAMAIIALFPLYWIFVTAFQWPTMIISMPPKMFPHPITLVNLVRVVRASLIIRWMCNSVFVSICGTVSTVLLSTLAGYVLAKKRFPGHDLIFWGILATLLIPNQLTMIPLFTLFHRIHLTDTYWGLIIPEMTGPYAIFLMTQYLRSLPTEIFEAAKIDGCSELGIFWRIVLPLAKPGIAVLGIFAFVWNWNSFLWPLIITSSEEMRVLQVGLATLQVHYMTDYGLLMAGVVITAIPIFIVFFIFQKYFLRGITIGAIKA